MNVPEPVYLWLLRLQVQLVAERGRNVTHAEVFEYVRAECERAAALVTDAKAAGQ